MLRPVRGTVVEGALEDFRPRRPFPFPALGAAPPDPPFGLDGLVLKRRTG